METVKLDGARLCDREEAMDTLGAALALPEWWGRNLDALYDCLTDLGRPVRLEVRGCGLMEEAPFGWLLLRVLRSAAQDAPGLELVLEKDAGGPDGEA